MILNRATLRRASLRAATSITIAMLGLAGEVAKPNLTIVTLALKVPSLTPRWVSRSVNSLLSGLSGYALVAPSGGLGLRRVKLQHRLVSLRQCRVALLQRQIELNLQFNNTLPSRVTLQDHSVEPRPHLRNICSVICIVSRVPGHHVHHAGVLVRPHAATAS